MTGAGDEYANRQKILKYSRLLRHRGPDASGVYNNPSSTTFLCHERLSIIDRSDNGKQPFTIKKPEGDITWVINSEIYNHKDIQRDHLQGSGADWTTSDSIVLGYLYQKFGPVAKVLALLDGIFCGVLYDAGLDEYFAFRDPVGVCPMYWGKGSDGSVWFASEMKALQEPCDKELLCFPPGHFYSSRTGKLERWYTSTWVDQSIVPTTPVDYAKLRDIVEKAVVKRLMSDCPLAVFLSGGLDSSLVASIASRHMPVGKDGKKEKLHTFCIGIKGAPDLKAAREVAEFLGTEHHEFYMTVQDGIDSLREVIYHLESYHQIRAATPHYCLARKIKAMGYKVVLSGEGADETLGGYLYFHKAPTPKDFHQETVRKTTRLYQWDVNRSNKACFAWGLEVRVPFLDKDYLECVMNMDPQDRMCDMSAKPDGVHPKMEKYVLRKAFDVPEDPYLPESVLWRQKEQFSDGVGYSWVDGLVAHSNKVITEEMWAARAERFPEDTPRTKEYYLLRTLFDEEFPNKHADATVAKGLSVACSTPEAVCWVPEWKNMHEISGRAIDVHAAASEIVEGAVVPIANGV